MIYRKWNWNLTPLNCPFNCDQRRVTSFNRRAIDRITCLQGQPYQPEFYHVLDGPANRADSMLLAECHVSDRNQTTPAAENEDAVPSRCIRVSFLHPLAEASTLGIVIFEVPIFFTRPSFNETFHLTPGLHIVFMNVRPCIRTAGRNITLWRMIIRKRPVNKIEVEIFYLKISKDCRHDSATLSCISFHTFEVIHKSSRLRKPLVNISFKTYPMLFSLP